MYFQPYYTMFARYKGVKWVDSTTHAKRMRIYNEINRFMQNACKYNKNPAILCKIRMQNA